MSLFEAQIKLIKTTIIGGVKCVLKQHWISVSCYSSMRVEPVPSVFTCDPDTMGVTYVRCQVSDLWMSLHPVHHVHLSSFGERGQRNYIWTPRRPSRHHCRMPRSIFYPFNAEIFVYEPWRPRIFSIWNCPASFEYISYGATAIINVLILFFQCEERFYTSDSDV